MRCNLILKQNRSVIQRESAGAANNVADSNWYPVQWPAVSCNSLPSWFHVGKNSDNHQLKGSVNEIFVCTMATSSSANMLGLSQAHTEASCLCSVSSWLFWPSSRRNAINMCYDLLQQLEDDSLWAGEVTSSAPLGFGEWIARYAIIQGFQAHEQNSLEGLVLFSLAIVNNTNPCCSR